MVRGFIDMASSRAGVGATALQHLVVRYEILFQDHQSFP